MDSSTTKSLLRFSIAFVIAALVLYFAKPKIVKQDDKVSKKKVVLVSLITSSIVGIVTLCLVKSKQSYEPSSYAYAPSSYAPSSYAPSIPAVMSTPSTTYGMLKHRYF